ILEKEYNYINLTRNTSARNKQSMGNVMYATWNIKEKTIDADAIERADYIIHLTGAGIADKRWTAKRKKEIAESRTQSSALLVKSIKEIPSKVKAVVSASAIGWYGEDP